MHQYTQKIVPGAGSSFPAPVDEKSWSSRWSFAHQACEGFYHQGGAKYNQKILNG